MSLRDMVNSYSSEPATATAATVATPTTEVKSDYYGSATATPATHSGLTVARVATVAVATRSDGKERLAKRWQWFIRLAKKHGINPYVVGAEFPSESDRRDVVEPTPRRY